MKKNREGGLRAFLFTCLGVVVTTVTVAGVSAVIEVPSRLGRPNVTHIAETGCVIGVLPSKNAANEEVKNYYVEYRNHWELSWQFRGGINKDATYECKGMEKGSRVQFRVSASNIAGMGVPSCASDMIMLRDPFSEF